MVLSVRVCVIWLAMYLWGCAATNHARQGTVEVGTAHVTTTQPVQVDQSVVEAVVKAEVETVKAEIETQFGDVTFQGGAGLALAVLLFAGWTAWLNHRTRRFANRQAREHGYVEGRARRKNREVERAKHES